MLPTGNGNCRDQEGEAKNNDVESLKVKSNKLETKLEQKE